MPAAYFLGAVTVVVTAAAPEVAFAKEARAAIAPQSGGYDGQWVIDATTSSFFCPVKRKQLIATVQSGKLIKLTGLPGAVTGSVDKGGGVTINIRLYGVTARVRGRVSGTTGAGGWTADSIICGQGQWSATAAR